MSRIPAPSSSTNRSRTPVAAASPTKPRVGTTLSPAPTSRIRTKSSVGPGTGSSSSTGSSTLSPAAIRTRTKSSVGRTSPSKQPSSSKITKDDSEPPIPALSIKEAIALKRAEAKKAQATQSPVGGGFESLEDAIPPQRSRNGGELLAEDDSLGRWSTRESIERGRSSGLVNISARDLPCIPSALFEIHLGITPDALKSVPNEPQLPPSDSNTTGPVRRRRNEDNPSWYEAQDLTALKAWSNNIVEIQHEISLFGSLKVVDLHKNSISSLPKTFGDLTNLTTLDLSHNKLTELPINIWTFPELTVLNLSHNQLTQLAFSAPFSSSSTTKKQQNGLSSSSFFGPTLTRSSVPLPRLTVLNASNNHITSSSIDLDGIPRAVIRLDMSFNPLSSTSSPDTAALIRRLGELTNLKELKMEGADIGDESFTPDTSPKTNAKQSFPRLTFFDLSETRVTPEGIQDALQPSESESPSAPKPLLYPPRDVSISSAVASSDSSPTSEGALRVLVGKKVIREAWEIEADLRAKKNFKQRAERMGFDFEEGEEKENAGSSSSGGTNTNRNTGTKTNDNVPSTSGSSGKEVQKESWEIEAEQGLLTEGGRRRARAAAGVTAANPSSGLSTRAGAGNRSTEQTKEVLKEAWEIEAEQGLLTEGGKRRARAQAALAAASPSASKGGEGKAATSSSSSGGMTSLSLANSEYYTRGTQTLALPPSAPPSTKSGGPGHARAFSSAFSASASSPSSSSISELAVPIPSVPLYEILLIPPSPATSTPFAHTLRVMSFKNRRADRSFTLPVPPSYSLEEGLLPNLEELDLEGCNFNDSVPVSRIDASSSSPGGNSGTRTPTRSNEPLLALISSLFPNLITLNLSYNLLTSDSLKAGQGEGKQSVLSKLLFAPAKDNTTAHNKKGLKHLLLKGNRLSNLDAFTEIGNLNSKDRDSRFTLDELDVRDNEIGSLPPSLGTLPLEVLLVDGNVFRVPPRRIWEREGTKGLLAWLRGRME
ncbi:hypothetical protein GYMLUDRAFT_192683 [Collybiopsis luxurians FD-317 M1]|nr:hypothetical protein GYMLUDRAFT_192683 [Collybiopsis luxurians FD-317 M1]